MNTRVVTIAAAGIVCVGLAAYHVSNISAATRVIMPERPTKAIVGQSAWRPFSADYEMWHHGKELYATGVTYRDSNGSLRTERTRAGAGTFVNINNRVTRTVYSRALSGEWLETKMPDNMAISGPRGAMRMRGLSEVPEEIDNLVVHRLNADSTVSFLAPELNFYSVRTESANGTVEQLKNIRLGEPPAEMFALPSGVTARVVPTLNSMSEAVLRSTPQ